MEKFLIEEKKDVAANEAAEAEKVAQKKPKESIEPLKSPYYTPQTKAEMNSGDSAQTQLNSHSAVDVVIENDELRWLQSREKSSPQTDHVKWQTCYTFISKAMAGPRIINPQPPK